MCKERVASQVCGNDRYHGAPARGTYGLRVHHGQVLIGKHSHSLAHSTMFPLSPSRGFARIPQVNHRVGGQCTACAQKETLLVLDAPAELVVGDCRRLAAQLLYLAPFVHPRQVNEHVRVARVFFFFN